MAQANGGEATIDLEKQVADLRKEMAAISKSLSARASEALDDADEFTTEVRERARTAARHVGDQAHSVGEVIRENPGTAATVLSTGGVLGFLLGVFVGGLLADQGGRRR